MRLANLTPANALRTPFETNRTERFLLVVVAPYFGTAPNYIRPSGVALLGGQDSDEAMLA